MACRDAQGRWAEVTSSITPFSAGEMTEAQEGTQILEEKPIQPSWISLLALVI